MTQFRNLLSYDPVASPDSSPGDEQQRASVGLADAVAQSHLKWWKDRQLTANQREYLLLAVAPFSQYDLTLLDLLNERLDSGQTLVQVFVANLQDYSTIEQLNADFPGIGSPQTPIAVHFDSESRKMVASGKKAREMAAQAVGLLPDELTRRIFSESPSYANTAARRIASSQPPEVGEV
jgi:hypothetical protein